MTITIEQIQELVKLRIDKVGIDYNDPIIKWLLVLDSRVSKTI